ncbi:hypothetical protein FOYG_00276 [Fusarium oxysporum NRRL 32931]|uniref:C2H2-type domain-containing protein n=1 Tax=Fusarium oxysporum NRRL 32931 TaxID=660029 RepID=W9IZM2_FUSOX|nr:hypothetical protein FOYG_00276 [Fusarium oxysporum NRRL 32931]
MKIGGKCYDYESTRDSGRLHGSPHIGHVSVRTPKNIETTDGNAPRLYILEANVEMDDKLDYGLSTYFAATPRGQSEPTLRGQEDAFSIQCKIHYRISRDSKSLRITVYHNEPSLSDVTEIYNSQHLVPGHLSHSSSRKETSDVLLSPEVEAPGQAKLACPDDNDLEVLGGAETNRSLFPGSTCCGQFSREKLQQESLPPGGEVVKSLKRPAEENNDPQKRSRTNMANYNKKRTETFACPYYRKDPERHFDCINLRLIRISDVKQHLKRRHTWSYSCSRCLKGFSLQKAYEEHVLRQECPTKDCINNDSVSPRAQKMLKDRVDRSSSPELQWQEICRILFGKLSDALNPHHEGVFKEITGIMRGIWRDEENNIISSLEDTQDVPCADQLRPLLSEILTRLEDCFERKEQRTPTENLEERTRTTQDIHKGAIQGGKTGHACEPPTRASNNMFNTGPIEEPEPVGLPTQQFHLPSYMETSDTSDYTFSCLMPTQHQNQFEYSYIDYSTSLLSPDIGTDWQLVPPYNAISMENLVSSQISIENSISPEDCLFSTQMMKDFGQD